MTLKYDLHSHSTASDGTLTPSELVRRARDAGVDVLALTDHDSTGGVREAESAAKSAGLKLVPGVEVSVTWNKHTVHIVGLNIDIDNQRLQRGLEKLVEFRDWRAEEIGRRLGKAGIAGAFEGARELSNGRLISRTHFARFLVEKGKAKTVRHVFNGFLIVGGGIKDPKTAKELVKAGADALVIGTFLEKGGSLKKLTEIAKTIQRAK